MYTLYILCILIVFLHTSDAWYLDVISKLGASYAVHMQLVQAVLPEQDVSWPQLTLGHSWPSFRPEPCLIALLLQWCVPQWGRAAHGAAWCSAKDTPKVSTLIATALVEYSLPLLLGIQSVAISWVERIWKYLEEDSSRSNLVHGIQLFPFSRYQGHMKRFDNAFLAMCHLHLLHCHFHSLHVSLSKNLCHFLFPRCALFPAVGAAVFTRSFEVNRHCSP